LMREPFLPFLFPYLDFGRELERKHRHQAAAMTARPTGTRTAGTTVVIAVSELIPRDAGELLAMHWPSPGGDSSALAGQLVHRFGPAPEHVEHVISHGWHCVFEPSSQADASNSVGEHNAHSSHTNCALTKNSVTV